MTAVLDASVALTWLLADKEAAWLELRVVECVVPEVFVMEVLNVLVRAERQRRGATDMLGVQLRDLQALRVRTEALTPARLFDAVVPLARAHRVSVFDAIYLELAIRLPLPLATTDAGVIRAAAVTSVPLIQG